MRVFGDLIKNINIKYETLTNVFENFMKGYSSCLQMTTGYQQAICWS